MLKRRSRSSLGPQTQPNSKTVDPGLDESGENRILASSESHNSGPSKTRQAVKERRQQLYRLWLAGYSEAEIASAYRINQSNVSRAIKEIRSRTTWLDKPMRERHSAILQETYDLSKLTIREAFRNYYSLKGTERADAVARAIILGRVQNAAGIIARLSPDLEQLALQEKIDEVLQNQAEVRRNIEEQKLRSRILPAQTGS